MGKFHISKDGNPRPCRARESNCPLGDASEHFKSEDEALHYIASKSEPLATLRKEPAFMLEKRKLYEEKGSSIRLVTSIEHNGENLTLTYTPKSIEVGDNLRGIKVSQYEIFNESGEQVAKLKLSQVTDESFKEGYGDDGYQNLRYSSRRSGRQSELLPFSRRDPGIISPDDLEPEERSTLLKKEWENTFRAVPDTPKSMEGYEKPRWEWTREDTPDAITAASDLKAYAKKLNPQIRKERNWHKTPFVDYSSVEESHKGTGLGKKLYVESAKDRGKYGEIIRGSGIQSDDAQHLWESLSRMGASVKSMKLTNYHTGEKRTYPILDYREQ